MPSESKRPQLPVFFYRTQAGTEPVRAWLQALPETDRRTIGTDLRRVQSGWPVGMPLCRSLGGGLWELRSNLASNRTARVVFFVHGDRIGVVHGFIKKTRATPDDILDVAQTNEGDATMKKKNPHWGSSLDDFLKEEGIYDEVVAQVEKEVIAWQLQQAMKKKKITKKRMAELMRTSRTQVDKLLNPKDGNVTIKTLHKAAAVVGKRFEYKLV